MLIYRKIAARLSVVTDVGFTNLLQTDNVLPKIKENIDTKLAQLLKDVEFLSLTTDIWSTSLSNESISMTIGGEFKHTSAVLHAQKIEGSHTGVAICQALESMLENWKIPKSVVADNASNMNKALREGHFEVNDGVLSVINTLSVCCSIVGQFKHSTIAYHRQIK